MISSWWRSVSPPGADFRLNASFLADKSLFTDSTWWASLQIFYKNFHCIVAFMCKPDLVISAWALTFLLLQHPSMTGCCFRVTHVGFSWTEFLFLLLLKLLYDLDLNFAGSDARKKRESDQEPLFRWWCPSIRHQPREGWWGMCNCLVRWGLAAKKEKPQEVLSCPIGRKKGVWDSVRALPGSSSPAVLMSVGSAFPPCVFPLCLPWVLGLFHGSALDTGAESFETWTTCVFTPTGQGRSQFWTCFLTPNSLIDTSIF